MSSPRAVKALAGADLKGKVYASPPWWDKMKVTMDTVPTYKAGDHVKVEFPDEVTGVSEWMWVRVEACDDSRKLVFGTLDNEPLNDYHGEIDLGSRLAITYAQIREHRKATEFTKQ